MLTPLENGIVHAGLDLIAGPFNKTQVWTFTALRVVRIAEDDRRISLTPSGFFLLMRR